MARIMSAQSQPPSSSPSQAHSHATAARHRPGPRSGAVIKLNFLQPRHPQAGGNTNSQPPPLPPQPGNGSGPGPGSGNGSNGNRPSPSPSQPTPTQPQPGTPTIAPSHTDSASPQPTAICPRLPTDPAPTSAVPLASLVPDWNKSACTSSECSLSKALAQLGPDTSWSAWALQGCLVAVPPTFANGAALASDVIWACSSKQTIVGPAVPATFPSPAISSAPCSMNCGSNGLPKRMPGKQPITTTNPDAHLLLLHGCLSKVDSANNAPPTPPKCAWLDLDSTHVALGLNRSMVDQGQVPALACTTDSGASIVVTKLDELSNVAPPVSPPDGATGGGEGGSSSGVGPFSGKLLPWVAGSLGVIAAAGLLLLAAVRYRRHRRNHHADAYYYTSPPGGGGRRSRRGSSRTRTSAYDGIHASTQAQLARTSHLPVRPTYPPPPIPIHHPHHLAHQHHHDSSFTSSTSSSNPLLHHPTAPCHSNTHYLPLPPLPTPHLTTLLSLQSLVDEWTSIFLALEHLYRVPAASLSLGVTRTRAVRAYLLTVACSQALERAGFDPRGIPRPLPLAWLAPHAVPRLSRRAVAEEGVLVDRMVHVLAQVKRVRNRGIMCSVIGPGEVPEKGWVVYLQQEDDEDEVGLGHRDVEQAPWVVAGTVWPGWVEEDAGQAGGVRVIVPARLYLVREWLEGQC